MTVTEQETILKLYKEGKTYREIWEITQISPHTVASFLRRKHKHLQTLRELARKKDETLFIKEFTTKHKVPVYQAEGIYASIRSRFEVKKQNTKASGKEFTVSFSEIEIPFLCPILQTPLNYFAENHHDDSYPTFDRKNNNLGYIPQNVHVVSWRANRLKNNGTAEEHRKIADWMDKNLT